MTIKIVKGVVKLFLVLGFWQNLIFLNYTKNKQTKKLIALMLLVIKLKITGIVYLFLQYVDNKVFFLLNLLN